MMTSTSSGNLLFDEEIGEISAFAATPIALRGVSAGAKNVTLVFQEAIPAGTSVLVEGKVKDIRGNSNRFSLRMWGKNTNPASVVINEFTTKGTEKQPDRVELMVTRSGNLGGFVVTDGNDRCILPDRMAWKGEYLVVQFQKGEQTLELRSEALLGLASNNGVLYVLSNPASDGTFLDAVAYSSRTATFDGWGNETVRQQVQRLSESKSWLPEGSDQAVDSTYATATRSFNRIAGPDTDGKNDWYITTQGHGKQASPVRTPLQGICNGHPSPPSRTSQCRQTPTLCGAPVRATTRSHSCTSR